MNDHMQAILSAVSLVLMGALGFALVFHTVPAANTQSLTYILGALSGALVISSGQKIADKITNNAPKSGDTSSSQS